MTFRTAFRTPAEIICIEKGKRGQQPTPFEICDAIYTLDELKGYKDALQRSGRLGDDEMKAIKRRLLQFESLFCRKIT